MRRGDDIRFEEELQTGWAMHEICYDHNLTQSQVEGEINFFYGTSLVWPGPDRMYMRAKITMITGPQAGKILTYGPGYLNRQQTTADTGTVIRIFSTGVGSRKDTVAPWFSNFTHTRGEVWFGYLMTAQLQVAEPTWWIGQASEVGLNAAPTPTGTPTVSPTFTPTISPTSSPTATPTVTPGGPTPTSSPTISPTITPTISPTGTPTSTPGGPTATASPTVSPTNDSDFDNDGIADSADNCSIASNPQQDDTDTDDCGNICDADYDDSGVVGFPDFGEIVGAFASDSQEFCHHEPSGNAISTGCTVGWTNYGLFIGFFGTIPGPSGTTSGTTACP